MKRRNFLKNASFTGVGLAVGTTLLGCDNKNKKSNTEETIAADGVKGTFPMVVLSNNGVPIIN